MAYNPDDIQNFLTDFQNNHHGTGSRVGAGGQNVSREEAKAARPATVPSLPPQSTSSYQQIPRTFQGPYSSSQYPSTTMTGGDEFDQSAPSEYTVSTVAATPAPNTAVWPGVDIPCEFVGWHSCDVTFGLDNIDAWCQHVAHDHLLGHIPKKLRCWYCDDVQFKSQSTNTAHLHRNLHDRFVHILDHIRYQHKGAHDIRIDWDMLEHLRKHDIIDQDQYNQTYNEWREHVMYPDGRMAEPHQMADIRPSTYVPQSQLARQEREQQVPVVDNRRRDERHNRRERRSRR